MITLTILLLIASSVSAFLIHSNHRVITTKRFMFTPGPDDAPSPLQVVTEEETASVIPNEQINDAMPGKKMIIKNLARGGEVKEVNFYDPAMSANTNPFQMEWWAYILVVFPFMLLANDFLHFLPTEGPLKFLSEY